MMEAKDVKEPTIREIEYDGVTWNKDNTISKAILMVTARKGLRLEQWSDGVLIKQKLRGKWEWISKISQHRIYRTEYDLYSPIDYLNEDEDAND